MRLLATAFGIAGTVAALRSLAPSPAPVTLVVIGDTDGYISPCGCSEPMTGGIKRQATVVRKLAAEPNTLVIDTGNLVSLIGRQDQLKAEALAVSLESMGVKAVNLTTGDARLGAGELLSLSRNMSDALISSSIEATDAAPFAPSVVENGVTVTGVSSTPERLAALLGVRPSSDPLKQLTETGSLGLPVVAMFDGDKAGAMALAKRYPSLAAITYRSTDRPPLSVARVGSTLLITPGERGQFVVSVRLNGSEDPSYRVEELGPDVPDDPQVSRFYRDYLKRVSDEMLWEKTPRLDGPKYVGSERCGSCHAESLQVWAHSDHSHALRTLAGKGNDRDPECLPCHVTGADFRTGFTEPQKTPQLAFVGCESCHGSGARHAAHPKLYRLPKVTHDTCESCHKPLNSPRFNFAAYWAKIKHLK